MGWSEVGVIVAFPDHAHLLFSQFGIENAMMYFVKYEKINESRMSSCNRCNIFSQHNLFSIAQQNVKVLLGEQHKFDQSFAGTVLMMPTPFHEFKIIK